MSNFPIFSLLELLEDTSIEKQKPIGGIGFFASTCAA
jgi:hypothetical protein